jgi:hypothetical protein
LTEGAGLVPALIACQPLGLSLLKIASAIWLLPEFVTHTNRIVRDKVLSSVWPNLHIDNGKEL